VARLGISALAAAVFRPAELSRILDDLGAKLDMQANSLFGELWLTNSRKLAATRRTCGVSLAPGGQAKRQRTVRQRPPLRRHATRMSVLGLSWVP
jgi:hypothetical protein